MRAIILAALLVTPHALSTFAENRVLQAPANVRVLKTNPYLQTAPTIEQKLAQMEATIEDINRQLDALEAQLEKASAAGELEALRLQMAMDRMSKMQSTLSNVQKKMSETSASITQNMK